MTSQNTGQDFVVRAVQSSPVHLEVLRLARQCDERLWLGGGAVRNLVWDKITGRQTKLDDFDLVYFDSAHMGADQDISLEQAIQQNCSRVIHISVRNQARMHLENLEPQRQSLVEAVANWPETATAIAAKLDANNNIVLLAPHGLNDLVDLVVRPTPYHSKNPDAFIRRRDRKRWENSWPEITYP